MRAQNGGRLRKDKMIQALLTRDSGKPDVETMEVLEWLRAYDVG